MLESLIKLAENPLSKADKPLDDDSMDYEEEKPEMEVDKGRKVSGPRTKLTNSEDRISMIENSVRDLAKSVQALAKSQQAILTKHMNYAEDDMDDHGMGGGPQMGGPAMKPPMEKPQFPPMDDHGGDDFGNEDDLDLGANEAWGEFDPYGHEDEVPFRGQDETYQRVPMNMSERPLNRARIAKDDSSSNFGEKDSDIPGNRPLVADDKETPATQYLIQGDGGDGPGPVSKAFVNQVVKAVVAELSKSKITKSVDSPDVGSSQVSKSMDVEPNVDQLQTDLSKLTFGQINRLRVEVGDLPAGIL